MEHPSLLMDISGMEEKLKEQKPLAVVNVQELKVCLHVPTPFPSPSHRPSSLSFC